MPFMKEADEIGIDDALRYILMQNRFGRQWYAHVICAASLC